MQNSDYNNIAFFPKCLTINSLDEGRTCFATYRWTVRPISDFWGHDCSVFKGVSSYLHNYVFFSPHIELFKPAKKHV